MTDTLPDQVVIISDFSNIQGGASKLALSLAQLLAAQSIPVTFFCGDSANRLPNGVVSVSLRGRRLLESNKFSAAVHGLWNRNAKLKLAAWIKKNDTLRTIYHVHGYHQTLSPAILSPLRRVSDRVVMHAHDYFLACPNGAFFDFRSGETCSRRPLSVACVTCNCDKRSYAQKIWRMSRQSIQNMVRNRLFPGVTTVMVNTGMEKYLFPDGSGGPICVVPNPAEPLLEFPLKAEKNHDIVYVGDIHHYKGVELLARAGKLAGVSVRFVGDGQGLADLKVNHPEHRFEGWQDYDGLRRILSSARLLVSPTLGPEPFGLAPIEALLSGIPVLMSDSMLLAQEIVSDEMGMSFAAGDCDDLIKKLSLAIGSDHLIAQLSSNAREKSHVHSLGLKEWGDALLAIYVQLLAVNGGAKTGNVAEQKRVT
jgi:glycosyltransferase involved in cell wall biosynthesis